MVTTVLQSDALVLEDRLIENDSGTDVVVGVRIRDDVIVEAGHLEPGDNPMRRIAGTLLPGLIDLQCNGAGGRSIDEATPEALDAIADQVSRGGAIAFLPTLITEAFEPMLERVAAVAAWIDSNPSRGAMPLGLHLEGPFLESPGTHEAEHFVDPTPKRVDAILRAAGGHLSLVTLAPDRAGAPDAVARLRAAGVAVALGHGVGTDQLDACVRAGAGLVTHLFNAMGPLHHRDPGFAGRTLDDERLLCSLIPDGVHVHESMLRNAYRCLGAERTILVTDSVAAAGMPDGDYELGRAAIHLADGVVRDDHGHLAGSALTMAEAASRWLRMVPSADACSLSRVAATNPARVVGAESLGVIAPGRAARFCVLDRDGRITPLMHRPG